MCFLLTTSAKRRLERKLLTKISVFRHLSIKQFLKISLNHLSTVGMEESLSPNCKIQPFPMEPFHLSYPSSFIPSLVNDSLCVMEEFFDGSKSSAEESIRTEHFVVSVHASIHATSPMRKSITNFREVPLRCRSLLCHRRHGI